MWVPVRHLAFFAAVATAALGAAADEVRSSPTDACSVTAPLPAAPASRPRYVLRVRPQRGLRLVTGTLSARFTAPPAESTDRLVFRLWPNAPRYASTGAHLSVSRVREAGRALRVSRPNATTLVIARPVPAGTAAVVTMGWRLALPRETGLRLKGGGRSLRLGSFFPVLAWDGTRWALDPPTRLSSGEAWTTPTADFDVHVTVPSGLVALTTGRRVRPGEWRADAVRDFTLALARFRTVTGTAHVPAPVRVTAGVEASAGATAPRAFLRGAIASLERYSALYGSYPWPTYTVAAMADLTGLTGGLEYPNLVYQPATSENVAHETGHQWFYSLVGNDQARDPWLDEGLTTWAEAAVNGAPPFADETIPPEVANRIGEPMTFWDRYEPRRYFLGVYLETYRALLGLGTRLEVDCALRSYVAANAYRTARPSDLLRALEPFFPNVRTTLETYGARF